MADTPTTPPESDAPGAEGTGVAPTSRPWLRTWQKGESPAIGGFNRPGVVAQLKYLRAKYGPDGRLLIDQLHRVMMRTGDHGLRARIAIELLNRGWGRPVEIREISGPDGTPLLTRVVHVHLDAPPAVREVKGDLGEGDVIDAAVATAPVVPPLSPKPESA